MSDFERFEEEEIERPQFVDIEREGREVSGGGSNAGWASQYDRDWDDDGSR